MKRAAGHLFPPSVARRTKQPYRAPDASASFPDRVQVPDYVDELACRPSASRRDGIFNPVAVTGSWRRPARVAPIGIKDNMALVGVLSTQLVIDQFVRIQPREAAMT